jgi:hypothetical protein
VKSSKRARQYEHIKESAKKRGRSTRRAKQIAAATVNKQRREAGETRGSRKGSSGGSRKRNGSARKRTGSARKRTGGTRRTSARSSSAKKR